MKRLACLLVLLALPGPAWGQVKVRGEATYKPFDPIVLKARDVTSKGAQFLWDVDGQAQAVEAGDTLYVWAPPGAYNVRLTAIDFAEKKVERARFTFKVEGKPPVPPGPEPPDPPGPKPPVPPTPVAGLKVLIVEESADRPKLPQAQQFILLGKEMRSWLAANCSPDPDIGGDGKGYAIWDKDVSASAMPKAWQDALARPRGSVPWVVVMDGKGTVVDGFALPADTAATIAALSKYLPKSHRKAG